ncbi:MAG: SusC/RagA family TonB-linked outer membrane protein [Bacteroidetes bacterium]|nr:SusC/RagA family TonB-linked outer membrane protein [Bacteroidota bacterium]
MRKLTLFMCCLLFAIPGVFAQTVVKGKVSDADGSPLSGVSIKAAGTQTGTTSAADGTFSLSVSNLNSSLEISYVGYEAIRVRAGSNLSSIQLKSSTGGLQEVVVTAQGIRREKKALGYAVASVDKKALELRPDGDVVRLLNGKAPGVDILNASGMSGSGTNIIIRGVNTISGSSTPLFIVDGVPFDASTNAQASFVYGNTTSSRFLDLDPNSIESINVLKGLSATTLYGELGRNGVVMITTKNSATRKSNKKMEITVSQSIFGNQVANVPEYQYSYGGGFDQSVGFAFFSNWGAKFKPDPGPYDSVNHPYNTAALAAAFPEYQGKKVAFKPIRNTVKNFFRTGLIRTTSVGVQSGGANGTFNANYTYMDDEGFTPGNRLIKNTFGLGGNAKLSNNFTIAGTFNYAITDYKAPPTATGFGSNPSASSVFGNLIYTPIAVDMLGLPYQNPLDGTSIYYRPANDIQHPLWTINNSFTGQKINRIFGNMSARYDIGKKMNLTYRVGYDQYGDYNFYSQNKGGTVGGNDFQLGMHRTSNGYNMIWDHSLLYNFQTDLNNDWRLNVDAGLNSQDRQYEQNGQQSTQQLVFGLFDHDNFIIHDNTAEGGGQLDFRSRYLSIGAFAQGLLSYKEYLYFTLGGRNSWSSNLEKANRSIFYPSASVSFIPTSAIESLRNNNVLNYLKLRAGYSTSANFGSVYQTRPILAIGTNVFNDRAGSIYNQNSISNRLANPNLAPELLQELEFGFEGKLLNNRLSVDFTYYNRNSKDQILSRDLDPSTGFTVTSINAGSVRNKGIELQLGYTVVRNKDWNWQLDVNYFQNRNKVTLPSEIKQIVVDGFSNEGLFAINGKPLGVIQGYYALRDTGSTAVSAKPTGQRIVDANGNYISSSTIGIVGDPTPDFKLTGISTLSFKGITFRMQWDYTQGGDMLAYTPGTVVGRGLTKDTDFDRLKPLILPGVGRDGNPNTVQISASQAYFNNLSGFFGTADIITFDATCIRLREASLSYSLPSSVLSKSPFGSLSITFSGQNLFYNAPNFPKYVRFDPETSSLGVSNVRGLEYLSGPTSRRFGASIRVTF